MSADLAHDLAMAAAERHGMLRLAMQIVEMANDAYEHQVQWALLVEIGRLLEALGIDDETIRERCREQWLNADAETLRYVVDSLRATAAEIDAMEAA